MTYTLLGAVGGESGDPIMEHPSVSLASSTVTIHTTGARTVTGAAGLLHNLATANQKAICGLVFSTPVTEPVKLVVISGWVGGSTTFTSRAGVIGNKTAGGARYVCINTSMQLELFDSNGVQIGHASRDTISTSGMTYIEISYDFGVEPTQPSSYTTAWITMKVNGRWQWEGLCKSPAGSLLEVGAQTLTVGEYLTGGASRGADLYTEDFMVRFSQSRGADIPSNTAYPILKLTGGSARPPQRNGSHVAWTLTNLGGTADKDSVKDFPNDGETTWVGSQTNSLKETYTTDAANPLTSADTVHHVIQRDVERLLAGGKLSFQILYRDDSGNEITQNRATSPGTSYGGMPFAEIPTAPDTTAWVYTDFDLDGTPTSKLQFGGVTFSAGTIDFRCTSFPSPEIIYSNASSIFSRGQD